MKGLPSKKKLVIGGAVLLFIIVIGAIIFFVLRSEETQPPGAFKIAKGEKAPNFFIFDSSGVKTGPSDYLGKQHVIINFWATWCPFCLEELSDFKKLADENPDILVVFAINRAESREKVTDYIEQIKPGPNFIFLVDPGDDIYEFYRGRAMPYSIFIDTLGIIRDIKLGPMQLDEMQAKLKAIL